MEVILTALGSFGDVHPMVGLGATLRKRGHSVAVITNPYFGSLIKQAGLELIPLSTREEYLRLTRMPDLWHPLKGTRLIFSIGAPWHRKIYEIITERYRPGKTVVCAHGLDFGSRIAQDKHGVPVASVHLAPVPLRSVYHTPILQGMWTADWVPHWMKRMQYWVGDKFFIDPIVSGPINQLRRELGLAPVSRFCDQWWFSPDMVLGLFPDWFAPPQPDWPKQTRLAGFPLWDESSLTGLSNEVTAFLDEGDPPLVFTPGSAMAFGESFFAAAVEACQQLGRRGVLLTQFADQVPSRLPNGIKHFEFVPLGQLLSRSAAFIHHGGIGSSARGLAAGIPQVIMPMAFDQHDNVDRLIRLGVADVLNPKQFSANRLSKMLDRLLSSNSVATSCAELAPRCDSQTALNRAADLAESLVVSRPGN